MKVFQDLTISGSRTVLDAVVAGIEALLCDGWRRNFQRESETRSAAFGRLRCYTRENGPACSLWLATRSDGRLYVSNILSEDLHPLPYDSHNAILREFHDRFAYPAAQSAGAMIRLGKDTYDIDEFLSPSASTALRSFSGLANRSFLHPLDRKRWNEFLALAYRGGTALSADMLARWLVEEERWPEDQAANLAEEFEKARGLLEAYESQHA